MGGKEPEGQGSNMKCWNALRQQAAAEVPQSEGLEIPVAAAGVLIFFEKK